jgi:hypothetical protein
MSQPGRLAAFVLGSLMLCAVGSAASAPIVCPTALHRFDPKELSALCRAAEQGDPRAQHNLGQAYFLAHGDAESNSEQAYAWFHRAALQGLPQSQFALAILHLDSRGVRGTFPEAMAWLVKSAQQGHGDAQYLLGLSYAHGVPGKEKDLSQVERWLTQSAEEGHALAEEVLWNLRIKGLLPSANGAVPAAGQLARVSPGSCAIPVPGQMPYVPYTRKDLEEAVATSAEQYVGRMETCLRTAVRSQGPGFVPMVPR